MGSRGGPHLSVGLFSMLTTHRCRNTTSHFLTIWESSTAICIFFKKLKMQQESLLSRLKLWCRVHGAPSKWCVRESNTLGVSGALRPWSAMLTDGILSHVLIENIFIPPTLQRSDEERWGAVFTDAGPVPADPPCATSSCLNVGILNNANANVPH